MIYNATARKAWLTLPAALLVACGGDGSNGSGDNGGTPTTSVIAEAEALLSTYDTHYSGATDWATIQAGDDSMAALADAAYVAEVLRVLVEELGRYGGLSLLEGSPADPEEAFGQSKPCAGTAADEPPPGSVALASGAAAGSGTLIFNDYCRKDISLGHPGPYVITGEVSWKERDGFVAWDTTFDDLEVTIAYGEELSLQIAPLSGTRRATDSMILQALDASVAVSSAPPVALRLLYADSATHADWDYQVYRDSHGRIRSNPRQLLIDPCTTSSTYNAGFQLLEPIGNAEFAAESIEPGHCEYYLLDGQDSSGAIVAGKQATWLETLD
ncbi:hypothetical protein CAI21_07340 [Alkalilimnicola ehrlichii]|uniref:Lipoprotein n=1 Tax=Alkalilimnicola ehrlichii TaxID=351052 RepID=A0A3E0WX35_9GAMM|nr:hypothetical protein [Alkalilimnicola ehrlichii]RFA30023.1 hypothetical protein CAI21_07340 [Alkalilimnicola ehrlichii]RFA37368.1 hypothetical protein CAL65_08675 [Alkalilimnicola ehrlichii]